MLFCLEKKVPQEHWMCLRQRNKLFIHFDDWFILLSGNPGNHQKNPNCLRQSNPGTMSTAKEPNLPNIPTPGITNCSE